MKIKTLLSAVFAAFMTATAVSAATPCFEVGFDNNDEPLTLHGSEVTVEKSVTGSSLYFPADKTPYATFTQNPFEDIENNFTISLWVYQTETLPWTRIFDLGTKELDDYKNPDDYIFLTMSIDGESNKPRFAMKLNGFEQQLDSKYAISNNEWHNITITREIKTVDYTNGSIGNYCFAKMYIDGVLCSESLVIDNALPDFGSGNTLSDRMYLGRSQWEADAYFKGYIDDIKIFDRALSADEIRANAFGKEWLSARTSFTDGKAPVLSISDSEITAHTAVTNNSDSDSDVTLLLAVYDTNGKLCGVSQSMSEQIPQNTDKTLTASISCEDMAQLKSFICTDKTITASEELSQVDLSDLDIPTKAPKNTYSHDPTIFKDPESKKYFIYNTHTYYPATSSNLTDWSFDLRGNMPIPQSVLDYYPEDVFKQSKTMWAPDIAYIEDDPDGKPYYLYYCYSGIGGVGEYTINSSVIGVLKADNPEMKDYTDCGIIYSSGDVGVTSEEINAIDPCYIEDRETGKKYLLYGSFWRGVNMLPLTDDGLSVKRCEDGSIDLSDFDYLDEGRLEAAKKYGAPIITRWHWAGVEGGYIFYNPENEYYYAMGSYDYFTYNYTVRVGRSKSVTGPYLDANGLPIDAEFSTTDIPYGYKLTGSYKFGNDDTYYAPGHNSVLYDDGDWYFANHVRRTPHGGATLQIRKMLWTDDGWPIVSPVAYAGEKLQAIPTQLLWGGWDVIRIGENTDAVLESETIVLKKDGTLGDNLGKWTFDGNHTLTLRYSNGEAARVTVMVGYDSDNNCPTLVFTGCDSTHIQYWGKKQACKTDSSLLAFFKK